MERFDVCVIGGGLVGLATARAVLERDRSARIIVLEKEPRVAAHQSGHNSGVVHSGVYYPPESLKSRFARAGTTATIGFARAHDVPLRRCGKLIVATTPAEATGAGRLPRLLANAAAIGLEHELLDAGGLRHREPALTGTAALWLPEVPIIDYPALARRLAADLAGRGVEIALTEAVTGIRERAGDVRVLTSSRRIEAGRLVACAGLQSDRIARLAGLEPAVRIVPFRGEYFRLAGPTLVDCLVYPVPDPQLPFLGVHISPLVGGGVSVGPSAVLGRAREGYRKRDLNMADLRDMATFPGLWRLAARHAGTGWNEATRSLLRGRYAAAVRRYAPSIRARDLRPHPAGIRAQAVRPDGTLVEDFLIARTDRMVHVLNAPSPAATAAFPIGEHIAEIVGP